MLEKFIQIIITNIDSPATAVDEIEKELSAQTKFARAHAVDIVDVVSGFYIDSSDMTFVQGLLNSRGIDYL